MMQNSTNDDVIRYISLGEMTQIVVQNDAFHDMISGISLDKLHHFGSCFDKDCCSISLILAPIIGLERQKTMLFCHLFPLF